MSVAPKPEVQITKKPQTLVIVESNMANGIHTYDLPLNIFFSIKIEFVIFDIIDGIIIFIFCVTTIIINTVIVIVIVIVNVITVIIVIVIIILLLLSSGIDIIIIIIIITIVMAIRSIVIIEKIIFGISTIWF